MLRIETPDLFSLIIDFRNYCLYFEKADTRAYPFLGLIIVALKWLDVSNNYEQSLSFGGFSVSLYK